MRAELASLVSSGKKDLAIVDVRNADEFAGQRTEAKKPGHIPGSVNIPWTRFFDEKGQLLGAEGIKEVFKQFGITPAKELVFVSNKGVRSGYVTFAALKSGFSARNYDGGLWEWSFDGSLPLEVK